MNCKDAAKLLISYLDAELSKGEKEAVELHLSTCPRCRGELESLSATQNRLRQGFAAAASKAPSAQAWAGLQQRLASEEPSEVATFSRAKSKLKRGLVSQQTAWKPALAGALGVVLLISLALVIPPLIGPSQEVLAAEIAQSDPQVHELLPEGTVVRVTKIVKPGQGGIFHVLFLIPGESIWAEEDESEAITIDALVDVRERKVLGVRAIRTEGIPITPLSATERERAVEIAKTGPRVQEILDSGAEIRRVIPLPFFRPSDSSLTTKIAGVVLIAPSSDSPARRAPGLKNQRWLAAVDLDGEKVVRLVETPLQRNVSAYAGSEGSLGYFPAAERQP